MGGEGGPRGRPACGSPSGSLGSPGCALRRDDGELLEFPAAGERGRPGARDERAARKGAASGPTLGGAFLARVLGKISPLGPELRAGPEPPPSCAALFGSGGGPVPPLPASAAERGQVQAMPLPQPPGFPLGPSPPSGVKSPAASSGRGWGWQGSGGSQVARGAAAGKTRRQTIPPQNGWTCSLEPSSRTKASKGFWEGGEVVLFQPPLRPQLQSR